MSLFSGGDGMDTTGSEGTLKLLALTFVVGTVLGLAGMAVWAAVDDGGAATPAPSSAASLTTEIQPQLVEGSASPTQPAVAADTRAHGARTPSRRSSSRSPRHDPRSSSGTSTSTP